MNKIFLLILIIFSSLVLAGCTSKKPDQNQGNNQVVEEEKIIPKKPIEQMVKEAPFVSMTSTADGHWINLEVKNVADKFSQIDYELIYLAGLDGNRIERGVTTGGKAVDLISKGFTKKILFGSESCTNGCKYRFDENVNEGTFSFSLVGKDGKEKYDSTFRIQKGKEAKGGFSTGDGKFIFTSEIMSVSAYYLTISTFGLPKQLENVTARSLSYGIFSLSSIKAGKVLFKEAPTNAQIYGYNGTWQKLETQIESGNATAKTTNQYVFVMAE